MTSHEILKKINAERLNLLSIKDYIEKYKSNLKEYSKDYLLKKAELREGVQLGMIKYEDFVIGGKYPGNYGIYRIINYKEYKIAKGRKRIVIPGGYDYVDSDDMNDLIPYNLKTTIENIEEQRQKLRTSIFSFPPRIYQKYKNDERLYIMMGMARCLSENLTHDIMEEIFNQLTPFEYSNYLQKCNKIDVSTQPSIEQPVKIHLSGCDDGTVTLLCSDVDSANNILNDLAFFNNHDKRRSLGFQSE